nr:hypothetical protein [uncultured Allomuricauda sp.]
MELVKVEQTKGYLMPIHTLPPESWDDVICKGLIPKILMLLSVNIERIPSKVAATELMIRESANRISPKEIEKAFLMYIKGELQNLEPMEGNISPILFNKVINQYKKQKSNGHGVNIENEIIISAYNHYRVMSNLKLKHDECFDFLLHRQVFKKGDQISEKTGKPWQEWYDLLFEKAVLQAITHSIDEKWKKEDRERVKLGNDPIVERFVKLEALKTYFDRFDNEDKLKTQLNNQ